MTDEEKKAKREKIKRDYQEFMKNYPLNPQTLRGEIWAWIEGYKGYYQISTYGRLKSLHRGKEKILRPYADKDGYLKVSISIESKKQGFFVHRLVAKAFLANPENKPEVNHKFGNKFDNYYKHLEWSTTKENIDHSIITGLRKAPSGAKCHKAKLNDEDVKFCREMYKYHDEKFDLKGLAEKFGVTPSCIGYIVRGDTYKDA